MEKRSEMPNFAPAPKGGKRRRGLLDKDRLNSRLGGGGTAPGNKLQQAKYDGVSSPSLCASVSEEILKAVKELVFDRYKLPADGSGMFKETLGFQLNVKLKLA